MKEPLEVCFVCPGALGQESGNFSECEIELRRDLLNVPLCYLVEIVPGKVLSDCAIDICIGARIPSRIGMSEVEFRVQGFTKMLMNCEFFAVKEDIITLVKRDFTIMCQDRKIILYESTAL